jgi:putative flippase GtrA
VSRARATGGARRTATIGGVEHRSFRHWGGYVFGGLTAFAVDLAITWVLVAVGFDPFSARLIALAVATGVNWLLQRRITFNVPHPPHLAEFVRFFVVASGGNAATLATYTLMLLLLPSMPLVVAVCLSSAVGGLLAYVGFRYGVFHRHSDQDFR